MYNIACVTMYYIPLPHRKVIMLTRYVKSGAICFTL